MLKLVVGDTVWLKSGSPKMTVREVEDGQITCDWFNNKQEQKRARYNVDQLTTEDPDELPSGLRVQ